MDHVRRREFLKTAGLAAGVSLVRPGPTSARQAGRPQPRITLACADYLRFTPLATGDLRSEDLDLVWTRGPRADVLRRVESDPEVDGGESSMLGHLLRIDRGDRSLVAVPVFVLRNFTARDLYTFKGSSITPATLNGSRVGIYNWAASGAVWYRHLLRHFGQDPKSVTWVVGSADRPGTVTARAPLPAHVTNAPADKSLTDLAMARELDGFFAPLPPKAYHAVDGPIVRVVPDFRAVEKRYFERTRCYPPQHLLLIRRAVWEKTPGLGRSLLELFAQCDVRFADSQRLYPYSMPWLLAEVEETERLMGTDFHAHGLEKNRHAMDEFCQGAFDDGLTKRRVTVDEFFAEFIKG